MSLAQVYIHWAESVAAVLPQCVIMINSLSEDPPFLMRPPAASFGCVPLSVCV